MIQDFLERDSQINFNFVSKTADSILQEKSKKVADRMVHFSEAGIDINESALISDDIKHMIEKHLSDHTERVIDFKTNQPFVKNQDNETLFDEKVKKDIRNAVVMSDDLEFSRARIENSLLRIFTVEDKQSKEKASKVISEWVDLRIIDLKSKPGFKLLYDSEFKNNMIGQFKQEIIEELGLLNLSNNIMKYEDFNHYDEREHGFKLEVANSIMRKDNPYDDTVNSNILKDDKELHPIVENSIGYENLMERLQAPENAYNLAHPSLPEKMLAEYYLTKRKDYRASKEMLEALDTEFNTSKFVDPNRKIGEDLIGYNRFVPHSHDKGLSAWELISETYREDPELMPHDITKLIELGTATDYAINGETQGVAESLVEEGKNIDWPDKLKKYDVRRTPKEWVEEKMCNILNGLFSAKERIEQNLPAGYEDDHELTEKEFSRFLSRNELVAFDKELIQHLNKDKMIMRLLYELDKEYSELNQKRMKMKSKQQEELNQKVQDSKYKYFIIF